VYNYPLLKQCPATQSNTTNLYHNKVENQHYLIH